MLKPKLVKFLLERFKNELDSTGEFNTESFRLYCLSLYLDNPEICNANKRFVVAICDLSVQRQNFVFSTIRKWFVWWIYLATLLSYFQRRFLPLFQLININIINVYIFVVAIVSHHIASSLWVCFGWLSYRNSCVSFFFLLRCRGVLEKFWLNLKNETTGYSVYGDAYTSSLTALLLPHPFSLNLSLFFF